MNITKIEQVSSVEKKSDICDKILRKLPDWFGNEKAITDYTADVQNMPFYAAYDGETAIGFVALKEHNPFTSEVCVMGILNEYHRHGIGHQLIKACVTHCKTEYKKFLTVKTLDSSAEYEPYDRTRNFYSAMGFIPLEMFPLHWDKDNPCLFLAKYIDV